MKKKRITQKEQAIKFKHFSLKLMYTLLLALGLVFLSSQTIGAATITVPDDYPTIQQAIDAAVNGDIVYVKAGTYFENITISKEIALEGEGMETTIIDGGGSGHVVYIYANNVTISGLTAENGEYGITLIPNYSIHHITLREVTITLNSLEGFNAPHSGGYHLIEDCVISYNRRGTYAHQFGNSTIRGCHVFGNEYGITVSWGFNTYVLNNEVHDNTQRGLHFDSMFNSFMEDNHIYNNKFGASVGYVGRNNTIRENVIHHNYYGITFIDPNVSGNRVYHNDVIENTIQAWDKYGKNNWDNGYPSGGNYWEDYAGMDLDNDGIGDTPYTFDAKQDNYPLMQSPVNLPPVAICQDVIVNADANCEGVVTAAEVDNNSYDQDFDLFTLSLDPVGPYPLGTTSVTLTIEDEFGMADQCQATVTVVDDTPPAIAVYSDPITLWPPNHKYATFELSDFISSVGDNCESLAIDDITILRVTSDELENGSDDGNTVDDIVILVDCQTIKLRKERNGLGNGRVYTIHFVVDDGNGNTATASCEVHVPQNKNGLAVDDGMAYDEECNKASFASFTENDIQLKNYPNPFNGSTNISFTLSETENTTLKVYDSYGKQVAILFDDMAESGQEYIFEFSSGNLPKGIYMCHLQSGNRNSVVRKMVLMK